MSIEVLYIIFIIAIPVYLLSHWVLKKFNLGNRRSRKFWAVIPSVVLSAGIYIAAFLIWFISISYYPKHEFDPVAWRTDAETRYTMSADIIERELLIGKTRQEVIALLGDDFYTYDENHIGYMLGFVPGFANIDPDILDVYFEDGKVIRVGQHES